MASDKNVATIISVERRVVQMPGRAYPGLVIQGDHLASWVLKTREIVGIADTTGMHRLIFLCNDLAQQLDTALQSYNIACRDNGLPELKT